jgi:hypothetical protein
MFHVDVETAVARRTPERNEVKGAMNMPLDESAGLRSVNIAAPAMRA